MSALMIFGRNWSCPTWLPVAGVNAVFGIIRQQRWTIVYRNGALSSRGPVSHSWLGEYTRQRSKFSPVNWKCVWWSWLALLSREGIGVVCWVINGSICGMMWQSVVVTSAAGPYGQCSPPCRTRKPLPTIGLQNTRGALLRLCVVTQSSWPWQAGQ